MELRELLNRIDALKAEVDALRPLDPDVEGRIMQKFRLDWNYHSSNIEGNSLTYGETKTFLLHGLTAAGKPLRDHLEIRGHNEAVQELQDIVRAEQPLTEQTIRGLHQLILGSDSYRIPAQTPDGGETSREVHPGRYKKEPNHVRTVTGEIFYFALPEETSAKMGELMKWYRAVEISGEAHPLLIAALFHYRFVCIHPFDDGNGRMARLLMNLILMRVGYPPVIIPTGEKEQYFRALRQADGGEEEYFVQYVGEELVHSLTLYLKGARGEEIEEPDDLDKKIGLLKASLEDEESVGRLEKSPERVHEVIENSFVPLLTDLLAKLHQIDDLFLDRRFDLQDGIRSSTELIERVRTNKDLYGFEGEKTIFFEWFRFLKRSPTPFDIRTSLSIFCDKYDYDIWWSFSPTGIRKPYGQFLTEKERERIVKEVVEGVLQQIEGKLKEGEKGE